MTTNRVCRCLLALAAAGIVACGNDTHPAGPDLTAPATIAVAPDSLRLLVNDTSRLRYTVLNVHGDTLATASVTLSSEDTTVAVVDSTGLVRARAGGVSDVTLRSGDATRVLRVRVRVNGTLVVTPHVAFIQSTDAVQLLVVVRDSTGTAIPSTPQYRSMDTAVAKVTPGGRVTFGGSAGSVMIQVSSAGRTDGVLITAVLRRIPSDGSDLVRVRGNTAFTLAQTFDGVTLQRLDLLTGSLQNLGPFPTAGYVEDFAVDHALTHVYVADVRQILNLDLVADTITAVSIAPAQRGPYDLTLGPGDSVLFFSADSQLYRMNLRTLTAAPVLTCQYGFFGTIANDSMLYGHCSNRSDVVLHEYNLRTNTPGRVLRRGGGGEALALSPDGTRLYLSNYNGLKILDLVSGDSIATILVPASGYGTNPIAVQPTTGFVWFASAFDARVYAVDPGAGRLVRTLQPGGSPVGIGFGSAGIGVIVNPNVYPATTSWIDLIR